MQPYGHVKLRGILISASVQMIGKKDYQTQYDSKQQRAVEKLHTGNSLMQ